MTKKIFKNLLTLKNYKITLLIFQNELPSGKKYSNHLMLKNALNQFLEDDYDYLICSSVDIIIPNNLFKKLDKIKK